MGVPKVLCVGATWNGGIEPAKPRLIDGASARARRDRTGWPLSLFVSRDVEDHAWREARAKAAPRRAQASTAAQLCFHRCSQERPFDGSVPHAR